ncbi:MAG: biotin--[acetyl-CoA-carboxylase] ligase [Nitrospiria bacterium]
MLDQTAISSHCRSHPRLGKLIHEVLVYDAVDSTNRLALEMESMGPAGGILILADAQKAGKGRLGRRWFSPPHSNIYLSLLLHPTLAINEYPLFSLASALGTIAGIQKVTGTTAGIKWPNDIFIHHKKIGGILLETKTSCHKTPALVIGIGINVNLDMNDMPKELRNAATSLKVEFGRRIDRTQLVKALIEALADQIVALEGGNKDAMILSSRHHCITLGRWVRIETPNEDFEGRAENIGMDGSLLIRMDNGKRRKLQLGEVTHLREKAGTH